MRRSRRSGERREEDQRCGATAISFVPLPRLVFPTPSPFFSDDKHPVDKAFTEVKFTSLAEIFGERLRHTAQDTFSNPLLESAVACLVWRKPFGQIFPAGATPEESEDAIENFAAVLPRSAAPIFPARRFWNDRSDDRPLFVSQFFLSCHRFSLARLFMRWLLLTFSLCA